MLRSTHRLYATFRMLNAMVYRIPSEQVDEMYEADDQTAFWNFHYTGNLYGSVMCEVMR